jgi:hypothetical protein
MIENLSEFNPKQKTKKIMFYTSEVNYNIERRWKSWYPNSQLLLASFYFFQNLDPSHRRMLDGWACYTLTWLKKEVIRLIDPYIVLVFSPSPTFVSINVTLTN